VGSVGPLGDEGLRLGYAGSPRSASGKPAFIYYDGAAAVAKLLAELCRLGPKELRIAKLYALGPRDV